ncbi:MAG TPA: hypothetical protein VGR26_18450 [Acidimicrobiales bacterium]|nr:hypothetical protein [Acidimicrobiales bacterium]
MPRANPSPKLAITFDPDVHAGVLETAAEDGPGPAAGGGWRMSFAPPVLLVAVRHDRPL